MNTPTVDEMRDMFRAHTEAAVKVIVEIMTSGTGAKGEAIRLAAAKEILNRGWGRPPAHKDLTKALETPPEWRNHEGKTWEQLYAEKAAEVAAAAKPGPGSIPPAPKPNPDPTGYVARRALSSAPANAIRS